MKYGVGFLTAASVAVVGVCCASASADILTYEANLAGPNEVPPNATPGTGYATITLDTATGLYTLDVSFSGLVSPDTATFIHGPAAVNANGPVLVTLPGFPVGVTSGTYNNSGLPAFTPAQMTDLAGGLLYLNIHTQAFPGGEIRDQFRLVPTPGAAALVGMGGLVAGRRRR